MAGKNPRPACVEDWDDELHETIPESQRVANSGAKIVSSRLDPRFHEPLIDGASDSGYSSRTAATINSTQSGPLGGKSPPGPLKQLDGPNRDFIRKSSSRKERKEKDRRPAREEKMQMGHYPPHHAPVVQTKPPRRRESIRQSHPEMYYEGGYQYHQSPSTPVEPRTVEPPYAYDFRPPMPDGLPMHSPSGRYETDVQYHSSRSSRRPTQQYHYHSERPMSWAMTQSAYPSSPVYSQFDRGPPPAWTNPHGYGSSPYNGSYYAPSEYIPDYALDHRERSESRTRPPSRARRASMYGGPPPPPPVDDVFPGWDDDNFEDYYNQPPPRAEMPRGRMATKPSRRYVEEDDEESARMAMPPPPPPMPRRKPAPQIHQEPKRPELPRKSATATVIQTSRRRQSQVPEPDLEDILPSEYSSRRASREIPLERSHSLRGSKRSTSYNESNRGAPRTIAVNNSLRRRAEPQYYPDSTGGLEDAESVAEQYIASRSGRVMAGDLPASNETLVAKMSPGPASEGSQNSRSNSSRGSGGASKLAEQQMTLMMNGMTIGFHEESLKGKSISIRTGDEGAASLNITDGSSKPRPKKYLPAGSSYSDHASNGNRRLEDRHERRAREERRTERAHRSSRSTFRG